MKNILSTAILAASALGLIGTALAAHENFNNYFSIDKTTITDPSVKFITPSNQQIYCDTSPTLGSECTKDAALPIDFSSSKGSLGGCEAVVHDFAYNGGSSHYNPPSNFHYVSSNNYELDCGAPGYYITYTNVYGAAYFTLKYHTPPPLI